MKTKGIGILVAVCVLATTISFASAKQTESSDRSKGTTSATQKAQEALDAAQTALDYQAIENVMSRHVHYHCYGQHEEEMEAIWVQETENQETSSFGNNNGFWVGYDNVYTSYVEGHLTNWIASAKSYCEDNGITVTDAELEDYYGVAQILMHCTTTEVLEVAEDGLTARGLWYSPGMICEGGSSANWIWEKYAVDFVKENGEWKIWHLHMHTDFMCAFGDTFTASTDSGDAAGTGEAGETATTQAGMAQQITDTQYTMWSSDRLISDWSTPEIPLSYESFSFEHTYGPSIEQYESLGVDVDAWYAWADSQTGN